MVHALDPAPAPRELPHIHPCLAEGTLVERTAAGMCNRMQRFRQGPVAERLARKRRAALREAEASSPGRLRLHSPRKKGAIWIRKAKHANLLMGMLALPLHMWQLHACGMGQSKAMLLA